MVLKNRLSFCSVTTLPGLYSKKAIKHADKNLSTHKDFHDSSSYKKIIENPLFKIMAHSYNGM